jgi:hypothetical protein
MNSGIRTEKALFTDLSLVYTWLSHHRGATIGLHRRASAEIASEARLEVGLPMTAAHAVICAVWLYGDGVRPLLGGGLSAIRGRAGGEPTRLVFDGKPSAHLEKSEAWVIADEMLEAIAERIEAGDLTAIVA